MTGPGTEAACRVRPASLQDIAAVEDLLGRSFARLLRPDYPPSVMVTAVPLLGRAQPSLLASGTYYVAEIGDRVVGAGGWSIRRRRRLEGSVRHFGTDPDYVRQGVASALMRHCLEEASAAGLRDLHCASTRTALGFYEAHGFRRIGPIEVTLAPGIRFPAIALHRPLGIATPEL